MIESELIVGRLAEEVQQVQQRYQLLSSEIEELEGVVGEAINLVHGVPGRQDFEEKVDRYITKLGEIMDYSQEQLTTISLMVNTPRDITENGSRLYEEVHGEDDSVRSSLSSNLESLREEFPFISDKLEVLKDLKTLNLQMREDLGTGSPSSEAVVAYAGRVSENLAALEQKAEEQKQRFAVIDLTYQTFSQPQIKAVQPAVDVSADSQRLTDIREKIQSLIEEKEVVEVQRNQLLVEKTNWESERDEWIRKSDEHIHNHSVLEEVHRKLQGEHSDLTEAKSKLEEHLEDLHEQNNDLEDENARLDEKLERTEAALEEKTGLCEDHLRSFREENTAKVELTRKFESQGKELEEELQRCKTYRGNIADLEGQLEAARKENEELDANIKVQNRINKSLLDRMQDLQKYNDQKEAAIAQERDTYRARVEELESLFTKD